MLMLIVIGLMISMVGCDKQKVESLAEIKARVHVETRSKMTIKLTAEETERIVNRCSPKQKEALKRMKEAFRNNPKLAKEWGVIID